MNSGAAKVLPKGQRWEWVGKLMENSPVVAPIAGHNGDVLFSTIVSPDEVVWDFENTLHPPKQFLLPRTDPLVRIQRDDKGYQIDPVWDRRSRVIFNIRSCDARGIDFLTRMHAMDLPDESYLERARNTVLITLACTVPCADGFCVCGNAGPFLADGYDVQLTDLGECLLAEPGSERGHALLQDAESLFCSADEAHLSKRRELEEAARRRFGTNTCHLASAMRRISTGRVSDALWAKISDWCLQCGACNMVCPTCYCFSVKDRKEDGGWVRCRLWDSCQYPAFTLEASGHNPRELQKDRTKRRFFHKVSAQYYERDGLPGCVGCGRCVKVCLGAASMPAVVAAVRKGVWHE